MLALLAPVLAYLSSANAQATTGTSASGSLLAGITGAPGSAATAMTTMATMPSGMSAMSSGMSSAMAAAGMSSMTSMSASMASGMAANMSSSMPKVQAQSMVSMPLVANMTINSSDSTVGSANPFTIYNISATNISASFIPYGARLTALKVPDRNGVMQDVVCGYDTGEQYLNDTEHNHSYFGAVVGRYANRIKNGTFMLNNQTYHIPANEHHGQDTLHGGTVGYDQRNWTVAAQTPNSITFSLLDEGFEGFPGSLMNYVTYTVGNDSTWTIRMVSIPLTEATPVLMSSHVYWNLDAFTNPSNATVLNETLWMPYSSRITGINGIEVPNGTLESVLNGPYDFTLPKPIGRDILQAVGGCGTNCTGYDQCFLIDRPRYAAPEATDLTVLTYSSDVTGIKLEIETNQQALQIYTCDNLDGTIPVKQSQQHGNGTTTIPQYGCMVIEVEGIIDNINFPALGNEQYQIYSTDTEPSVVFAQYHFSVMD